MNELRCKRISHPPVEKDGFRILADLLQPFHEKRFSANAIDRESFFARSYACFLRKCSFANSMSCTNSMVPRYLPFLSRTAM